MSNNPFRRPGPASTIDWRDRAACRDDGRDTFFADGYATIEKQKLVRAAKAICADCPVALQCLQYAIEHDIRYGIWGGLTATERGRLVRSAHGTTTGKDCGSSRGHRRHRALREIPCERCKRWHADYIADRRAARRLSASQAAQDA